MTRKRTAGYVESEFEEKFVDGMRDRMQVSYHKYGPLKDAYPHKVDAIKSLELRLEQYKQTGNTEFLMDVANYAMIEFMRPAHPEAHYKPTDSAQSPGRKWQFGGRATKRANS